MGILKRLFSFTVGYDRMGKKVRVGDTMESEKGNRYRVCYNRNSCCFFLETIKKSYGSTNLKEGITLMKYMKKVG